MKHLHFHYKKPLLGLVLFLVLAGIYSYSNLKTGLFPDITFPKIKVIADAGQQPVDKMMAAVTIPLENSIRRTEGLDYIHSTTSRGSCEISVYLAWGTDVDEARLQIESFINQAKENLLPGTEVSVEKMNPSILPVMGFSLEGKRSQIELKKIALLQIKPFLAATPGVSDVVVTGGKTKEYQVILNPEKLSELGISPRQIADVIENSQVLKSNGYISDHDRLYLTLTDNAIVNLTGLENLVIRNTPQREIRLKDIALVKIGEMKEYVKINANGKDVPLIAVVKQPDANLIEVNTGVLQKVKELEKILPSDVRLRPFYLQADFVNDSVKSIKDVLWIGLVLSIIVVIIFLRSMRSSFAVGLTIPASLALTLVVLYSAGYTFNIMTLGAIAAAMGLMIDDAVIVAEQIHRSSEEQPDEPMPSVISKAIHYLLPALVSSSLATIVIFIPFVLMSGVAGAYFKVLAFTMIIALASSFFVTWLVLPLFFLIFPNRKNPKPIKTIENKGAWISWIIHRWYISLAFAVACIAIIYILPQRMPSGFLPEMDEGGIVLDYSSPPGTTLEETDLMLRKVDKILQQIPEVESFSRRTGTQMGFFITEPNTGDYLIQLKKKRENTTDDVSDVIRKKIEASIPELRVDFGQVIGDMLGDLMSSVQPVEIKVFGDNKEKLETISVQIAGIVGQVKGTADVFDGIVIAGPEIKVEPMVAKLAQFGINPSDFQFQMETQLEGNVISSIMEKEQMVNVRMMYPGAQQLSLNSLKKGDILLPNGLLKPVNSVTNIYLEKGVAEIERENQKMMGVVTARLNNRDLGSTLKDIQSEIRKKLSLPSGYHVEFGGSYAQQQRAFSELLTILFIACLLVFIVLLVMFRGFIISLYIIGLALLGIAGSLLALFITKTPLNVGSYTGIIMIVGIVGENAVFTCQKYLQARLSLSPEQSIRSAISARLRPNLMTASAAIVALLPLALGIGTGSQMHQPLAIAVIGGFIFALPLLLIVLPTVLSSTHRHDPN
ncbi:MAG: efflux RND transporter permease subunit [Bacteroidia bacterium]|nr:efflux RND transporter permease subunit [Bacteroidia bacterium]